MVFQWQKLILLACCQLFFIQRSSAEFYSAIIHYENLLRIENGLLQALRHSISQQESRLELLETYVAQLTDEYERASKDPEEYLNNPINVYLMMKRLTTQRERAENLLKQDLYAELTENLRKSEIMFPTNHDLIGATSSLTRLQVTYDLDTESIARGELNGIKQSTNLSADDCFDFAIQTFNDGHFQYASSWLRESLKLYEMEKVENIIFKGQLLEWLASSSYAEGNIQAAYQSTLSLLALHPNHERARSNLDFYADALANEVDVGMKEDDTIMNLETEFKIISDQQKLNRIKNMLCRRNWTSPLNLRSQLRCRYIHKNNPFLFIAPLKEEEALLRPRRILLYRQVLSSNEIDTIKLLATPRFDRARVVPPPEEHTGTDNQNEMFQGQVGNVRIGEVAWLGKSQGELISNVERRIGHIASLSMDSAEELQVVKYGVGGHYEMHHDFISMNNVVQGGATVFPHLKLSVQPEEGTAVIWMNLHPSGRADLASLHSACPVLQGSKWICNSWLHEKGQEFMRPCNLADNYIRV